MTGRKGEGLHGEGSQVIVKSGNDGKQIEHCKITHEDGTRTDDCQKRIGQRTFIRKGIDVNGKKGPNVWGKDVYGYNVYANKIEPLGKNEDPITIETDCSRQGTGVYCSFAVLHEIQEP